MRRADGAQENYGAHHSDPTVTWHVAGFCVPRNQWTPQPADAVDCPPQTYMQNTNGQTVW